MSILFIIDVIIGSIGLIALGIGIYMKTRYDESESAHLPGVGILVIGVILLVFTAFTSVPAQSVGVVTSFGKPVNELGPGVHWKAPWQRVQDMDGKIQIDDNLGKNRTEIRLGNGSNAYVQNALRWKIRPEAAGGLWADYRSIDRIATGLVDQELAAALNSAFAGYNPLATANGASQSYDDVATKVKERLVGVDGKSGHFGARIIVESVIIPKVDFDDATQHRIDALQQEVVNTRIATQREQTAKAEARANEALAASVTNPNVLVARCMDLVKASGGSPFGCWPGTGSVITDTRKP
jgi:regulator of protease activity HflC (stomatin/prohibitin superfamily)